MNIHKQVQIYSIKDDYSEVESIAIIPVKDFDISEKYQVNEISIYPPNSIKEKELAGSKTNFNFLDFSEDFFGFSLIVFPIKVHKQTPFSNFSPQEKNSLLNIHLSKADDVMSIFKYIFCNLDNTSLLMQRAGFINNTYSGMLIYYPSFGISDFLIEKYRINNEFISKGLAVNIKVNKVLLDKYMVIMADDCEETGNIARHALRLYSNIIESTNLTNKYTQSLSLIEYLANPFKFEKMQTLKGHILSFTAKSKKEYHELSERFKLLTGLKNDKGEEIGLRTSIIHNGMVLEQLLDKPYEGKLLIKELQTYICNYLEVCFANYDSGWSTLLNLREKSYDNIMKIKKGFEGRSEADVLVLIDFTFLNKALKEIYQLYPQHIDKNFDMAKFLYLCTAQSGIDRVDYKIPFQFIIESNENIYNDSESKKIQDYEQLGFTSDLGEFDIHVTQTQYDYYQELESFLYEYTLERNFVLTPSSKFDHIIFISDRNLINHEFFKDIEESVKYLYLGRLDNMRTTSFGDLIWFDIQNLFCSLLGIELHENTTDNFIFE